MGNESKKPVRCEVMLDHGTFVVETFRGDSLMYPTRCRSSIEADRIVESRRRIFNHAVRVEPDPEDDWYKPEWGFVSGAEIVVDEDCGFVVFLYGPGGKLVRRAVRSSQSGAERLIALWRENLRADNSSLAVLY